MQPLQIDQPNLDNMHGLDPHDSKAHITDWAQTWVDRFRLDADEVDGEVHALCNKIRGLLTAIESREA